MGLFGKRKTRATRRAEARAIKAKAKLEAKLSAKNEVRRFKAAQRAETKALSEQMKSQRDSDRTALKVAEANLKAVREGSAAVADANPPAADGVAAARADLGAGGLPRRRSRRAG